jgi:hypothetical protein
MTQTLQIPKNPQTKFDDSDILAVKAEFALIDEESNIAQSLINKAEKGEDLTDLEKAFLMAMPPRYRLGVELTRILRRTNTGPAKVKEKKTRTSAKQSAMAELAKGLQFDDDDE